MTNVETYLAYCATGVAVPNRFNCMHTGPIRLSELFLADENSAQPPHLLFSSVGSQNDTKDVAASVTVLIRFPRPSMSVGRFNTERFIDVYCILGIVDRYNYTNRW